MVNFLTEITSNLATTAMLLPVLVALANTIDINSYYLLVGATVAASCAFMLPVATPPNAVVFGSKILNIDDIEIVISNISLEMCDGMTIDYVELEKNQFNFIFLNPKDPNYVEPKE